MEEFNTAVFNRVLSEVPFDGSPFTWTNGRILQRFDKAFTNSEWTSIFDSTHVSYMARGRSDHAPLLIKCGSYSRRCCSFRFLNAWTKYHTFFLMVSQS